MPSPKTRTSEDWRSFGFDTGEYIGREGAQLYALTKMLNGLSRTSRFISQTIKETAKESIIAINLQNPNPTEIASVLIRSGRTEQVARQTAHIATDAEILGMYAADAAQPVGEAAMAAEETVTGAIKTADAVTKSTDVTRTVAGAGIVGEVAQQQSDAKSSSSSCATKTLDDILKECQPGKKTKGPSRQFEKTGDYEKALKDFNSLNPQNIRDIKNGKVANLLDGRTINVRMESSRGPEGSAPTLEIQEIASNKKTKIRYRT